METGGSVSGNLVSVEQGAQGAEITGAPKRTRSENSGRRLPEGVEAQENAIPGVNFFSDMGRKDSGWFRSSGRNVYVPGGTVLAFAIVTR